MTIPRQRFGKHRLKTGIATNRSEKSIASQRLAKTRSRVNEDSAKVSRDTRKKPMFSMDTCWLRPACRRPACAGGKNLWFLQLLLETCYVLRASDQFRLQELLYVQQFKIMASKRRARKLFLLENCALKYDMCGNSRQSKLEIFRNRLQLGEFHHLYRQLRADSNKFFEYCRMLPAKWKLSRHTFLTYLRIFRRQYL
jgi:hypothetical protein